MEKEALYRKLVQALLNSGFRLRAQDLTEDDVKSDRNTAGSFVRVAAKAAPAIIKAVAGVHLPESMFELHPTFDQNKLQQHLDSIREFAAIVCFKYYLAQPTILAVVEADGRSPDELILQAKKFDQALLAMREVTGEMGGIQLGSKYLLGTKLSVTGILLLVFFDHVSASSFAGTTQDKCTHSHFWAKTYLVPWTVDVSAGEINRPRFPIVGSPILNETRLKADVFGA